MTLHKKSLVECFRDNSPLKRVGKDITTSFRAYLFGLVRNSARNFEKRLAVPRHQPGASLSDVEIAADDPSLSVVFDRAWARMIIKQAGEKPSRERETERRIRSAPNRAANHAVSARASHPPYCGRVECRCCHPPSRIRESSRRVSYSNARSHPFQSFRTDAEIGDEIKLAMQLLST